MATREAAVASGQARQDVEVGHVDATTGEERSDEPGPDAGPASFDELLGRARLVELELDLAETRRRIAEDNLKITEAQLELAERQIADLKAENDRLRREIEGLRGG